MCACIVACVHQASTAWPQRFTWWRRGHLRNNIHSHHQLCVGNMRLYDQAVWGCWRQQRHFCDALLGQLPVGHNDAIFCLHEVPGHKRENSVCGDADTVLLGGLNVQVDGVSHDCTGQAFCGTFLLAARLPCPCRRAKRKRTKEGVPYCVKHSVNSKEIRCETGRGKTPRTQADGL